MHNNNNDKKHTHNNLSITFLSLTVLKFDDTERNSFREKPKSKMEEDSEEKICRVCRGGEEEGNELYHPCLCKGSISYVHKSA